MRPELPAGVDGNDQADTTEQEQVCNGDTRVGGVRCVITTGFESTADN